MYQQKTSTSEIQLANTVTLYQYKYFNPMRDWGIICRKGMASWKKPQEYHFVFALGSLEYVDKLGVENEII